MAHNYFENFGVSKAAATVYMAALKRGESSISDIARQTRLPRSSVLRYLNELSKNGFINYYLRKKRKVVVAESPERIRDLLREHVDLFEHLIPSIKKNISETSYRPRVYFYEGRRELERIYGDILMEQRPIDAITSPDDTYAALHDFFDLFIERRMQKKIPMRLLVPDTAQARLFKKKDAEFFRTTHFLRPGAPFKTATYIYGDKVAIISLRSQDPSGFIIDDPYVADAQRSSFELLWNAS